MCGGGGDCDVSKGRRGVCLGMMVRGLVKKGLLLLAREDERKKLLRKWGDIESCCVLCFCLGARI